MNTDRILRKFFIAIASLTASAAMADEGMGAYAGVGIADATVEISEVDFDASNSGFRLFGGMSFNEYFAAELAYINPGSLEDNVFGIDTEIEGDAFTVSALGSIPLGDIFSVYGRLGYGSYNSDLKMSYGGFRFSEETHDDGIAYGGGAAVNIGSSFQLRLDYEALELDSVDFSIASLNGVFKF